MIYRLIILNGDRKGEQVTLTRGPMIIGRDTSCEIRLNDPEIALKHAEITHTEDGIHVRDLGSMNRLLINNREVREATPKHGDVMEVGHTRFLIQAYVQAEVQNEAVEENEEDKGERLKPWLFFGGMTLFVAGLFLFVPHCERQILTPRTQPLPERLLPPKALQPPLPPAPKQIAPAVSQPSTPPSTPVTPVAPPTPPKGEITAEPPPTKSTPAPPREAPPVIRDTPREPPRILTPSPSADLLAASEKELAEAERILNEGRPPIIIPFPSNEIATVATAAGPLTDATSPSPPTEKSTGITSPFTPEAAPPKAIAAGLITSGATTTTVSKVTPVHSPQEVKSVPATTGLIMIKETNINKFPETDQFREMRRLTVNLAPTGIRPNLDPSAVHVEVLFYDQDKATGKLITMPPQGTPAYLAIQGRWNVSEPISVVSSYVIPATMNQAPRTSEYYGFLVGVYYNGILQDEIREPRDLPRRYSTRTSNGVISPAP